MSINIYKDQMQYAELFGKPVLHTAETIPRETVPDGWHCYELSGNTRQPERAAQLVNRATAWLRIGSVLSPAPLKRDTTSARQIKKDQFSLSDRMLDLAGFCQEQGLPCPHDPRKYVLRPASKEEAGLFYSRLEPEQDAAECTVGHLRMDFSGGRLHHSWWPHNDDQFNTPEFKAVLQELVDELRARGPLKDQSAMSRWCYQHTGGEIQNGHFGFIAETEDYRFCLRCTTMRGDYSYLYCYDLNQQRLAREMEQASQPGQESQVQDPLELRITDPFSGPVTLKPRLGLYSVKDFMGRDMPGLALHLDQIDGGSGFSDPYATLTKCFGEFISIKNAAYIDANNCPFADQLLEQGIAEPTGLKKTSGFCTYPLWIFKEEFLQGIGGENYQKYAQAYDRYMTAPSSEDGEPAEQEKMHQALDTPGQGMTMGGMSQ